MIFKDDKSLSDAIQSTCIDITVYESQKKTYLLGKTR